MLEEVARRRVVGDLDEMTGFEGAGKHKTTRQDKNLSDIYCRRMISVAKLLASKPPQRRISPPEIDHLTPKG